MAPHSNVYKTARRAKDRDKVFVIRPAIVLGCSVGELVNETLSHRVQIACPLGDKESSSNSESSRAPEMTESSGALSYSGFSLLAPARAQSDRTVLVLHGYFGRAYHSAMLDAPFGVRSLWLETRLSNETIDHDYEHRPASGLSTSTMGRPGEVALGTYTFRQGDAQQECWLTPKLDERGRR
jgi:hypothetical protein